MKYEPVKVRHIVAVQYKKANKPWHPYAVGRPDGIPTTYRRNGQLFVVTGQEQHYWQVQSGLLGKCGHKHKTEKAAGPCFQRMKKRWSALRSQQSKKAFASRKKMSIRRP
jgi:hypothetical protein